MKIRIKLLTAWKDAAGTEHAAGTVLDFDEDQKAIAADLVLEGKAERVKEDQKADDKVDIKKLVAEAVKETIDAQKKAEPVKDTKAHAVETHDKFDDDPGGGYLPQREGNKWSRDEKVYHFSRFCRDVAIAGTPGREVSENLKKLRERSEQMQTKAMLDGMVSKAAGDGLTAGVSSEGGFTIPIEFNTMLLDASEQVAVVRPLARKLQLGSQSINQLPFGR